MKFAKKFCHFKIAFRKTNTVKACFHCTSCGVENHVTIKQPKFELKVAPDEATSPRVEGDAVAYEGGGGESSNAGGGNNNGNSVGADTTVIQIVNNIEAKE